MDRYGHMVRFNFVAIFIGFFMAGAQSYAAPEMPCWLQFKKLNEQQRAQARRDIDAKRAEFQAKPPSEPVRTLRPDEVSVTAMNGGKPFEYEFVDQYNSRYYEGAKSAIGNVVSFKTVRGKDHKIEIVGLSMNPQQLREITEKVLKLPADTLDATKKIEIQTFERDPDWHGSADNSMILLNRSGLTDRTLRHEFGHNLAYHIWGNRKPFEEWTKVVQLDGRTFTTPYAERTYSQSGLTEDFAEAVAMYLDDVEKFRTSFPARAALLDTVFRSGTGRNSALANGGVWQPLRDDYHARLSLWARAKEANPAATVLVATSGAAITILGGAAYFLKFTSDEITASQSTPTPTPRPKLPENPR